MAIPWQRRDVSQGRGSVVVTPLTGGVRLDVPSSRVPAGAFTRIEGFQVRPKGPHKLPLFKVWKTLSSASQVDNHAELTHIMGVSAALDDATRFVVYSRGSAKVYNLDAPTIRTIPWWDAFTFANIIDTSAHTWGLDDMITDATTSVDYTALPWNTLRIRYGDRIYLDTIEYEDVVQTPTIGTVTVTIATPAVFSRTAHGLVAGDKIRLTTTGALPTGLTAGTAYYVLSSGLTANAFKVSLTRGGTAVNTSGSQSGTHTLLHFSPYYIDINSADTSDLALITYNASTSNPPASGTYSMFSILRGGALAALNQTPDLQPLELSDVGLSFNSAWVVSENYPFGRLVVDADGNVLLQSFLVMTADSADFNYNLVEGTPNGTAEIWQAYTGCQFRSFFFTGNTVENDSSHAERIRWSDAFDPLNNWTNPLSYFDLAETGTIIRRLLPNGEQLMVYADTSIWYGFETADPTLPLAFRKLDTGGVGIVNKYAVAAAAGTHFFVGQNNIYVLQGTQAPKDIGTPVILETIQDCQHPENIRVTHDPTRQRVLFGFPKNEDVIEELWMFDYITGAWSMQRVTCNYLEAVNLNISLSADSTSGTSVPCNSDGIWNAQDFALNRSRVFIGALDAANSYNDAVLGRPSLVAIDQLDSWVPTDITAATLSQFDTFQIGDVSVLLETGAIDLDNPDVVKAFSGCRLSIEEDDNIPARKAKIEFKVFTSEDDGESWVYQGLLVLPSTASMGAATDVADALSLKPNTSTEGSCAFLVKAQTLRIRLTSSSLVAAYDITQYNLWVKAASPAGG